MTTIKLTFIHMYTLTLEISDEAKESFMAKIANNEKFYLKCGVSHIWIDTDKLITAEIC